MHSSSISNVEYEMDVTVKCLVEALMENAFNKKINMWTIQIVCERKNDVQNYCKGGSFSSVSQFSTMRLPCNLPLKKTEMGERKKQNVNKSSIECDIQFAAMIDFEVRSHRVFSPT